LEYRSNLDLPPTSLLQEVPAAANVKPARTPRWSVRSGHLEMLLGRSTFDSAAKMGQLEWSEEMDGEWSNWMHSGGDLQATLYVYLNSCLFCMLCLYPGPRTQKALEASRRSFLMDARQVERYLRTSRSKFLLRNRKLNALTRL
jgi:hypothetical protein